MCLAVPGRVESIDGEGSLLREGVVSFGGLHKKVSLAYVPEASVGDYVIVHVGFALSLVNEQEAERLFSTLEEIDELEK